jgi:hypothetical protein
METGFRLSLNRLRNKPLFSKAPAAKKTEQLFLAPEFSEDVLKAVRLISTCMHLKANDKSRLVWQSECNATSFVEYDALLPLFSKMKKPKKILEIGAGLGRSAVVFSKKQVWEADASIHLYDTNGSSTKYKQKHYDRPPKWPDVSSFCGNLELLDRILKYNELANYKIFDAAQIELKTLPGPYDLIYGFYSIGFHWSLEHYLDDIDPLMGPETVLICTLNKHFEPFKRLENYSARVLEAAGTKKGARPLSYLALSKSALPEVGLSVGEAYPG